MHHAIVWNCTRTAGLAAAYAETLGGADAVRAVAGLPIVAYFAATKRVWLFEHLPGRRARAEAGELCFGTIDALRCSTS